MHTTKFALSLACAAMVASCGGGGGSSPTPAPTPSASAPAPTPSTGTAACSLIARQNFAREVLEEWYLFPDLLATSVIPGAYSNVQDYIDALVAPARAQGKDRFFTYLTSIEEENAFFEEGASAGFGFRLVYDSANRRLLVSEAFEGTPALAANLDRGTRIIGIGTSPNNIQSVSSLFETGGSFAVYQALGGAEPGTTRVLRVIDASGVEREVSLTKVEFELDPVSDRYGAKIINDGGRKVGYVNLRTFIGTANDDLTAAFAEFRTQGVTEIVVDLRYNGGGAISVAEHFGDLMGRDLGGKIFDVIAFRPSKASLNETYRFNPLPQSIAPTRIAFIGTQATASASEMVINGMQPFLGDNMALVGENTYGKPVGQSAFDKPECDDRLRAVTLKVENADGNGEYFNGLAFTVPNTCRATDDLRYQLGDPRETMLATALDFLAGRSCTSITGAAAAASTDERGLLQTEHPDSVAQREVPGLF